MRYAKQKKTPPSVSAIHLRLEHGTAVLIKFSPAGRRGTSPVQAEHAIGKARARRGVRLASASSNFARSWASKRQACVSHACAMRSPWHCVCHALQLKKILITAHFGSQEQCTTALPNSRRELPIPNAAGPFNLRYGVRLTRLRVTSGSPASSRQTVKPRSTCRSASATRYRSRCGTTSAPRRWALGRTRTIPKSRARPSRRPASFP